MPTVIPVKFTYATRELWFDAADTQSQEADHVICHTERGLEIGLATSDAFEIGDAELRRTIGDAELRRVERIATDYDLERAEKLAQRSEDAMPAFRRLVAASGLEMKPVGVEFIFDGEKAVCYFAAEDRVDFRQLVRDLSREFHVRIDMRQIGVREEAAIVGGYGHCGQELCCRRFNTSFDPVSIRMAKEQDLPLNSTKISGACGRLMCCLRYEFEAYRDFKSRAPKRNAVIDTPLGKGKIIEYDTPKEQICLRLENGKQIRVALADMTASEAACKKSEELGCACRPDTVTRDVLDRLQSPDVQMALAELDRKNGVLKEETFDTSDIFVEPKRKRRQRPANEGAAQGQGAGAGSRGGSRGGETGGAAAEDTRRRRKQRPAEAAGANAGAAAGEAGAEQGSRRRRHHRAAGEGGAEQAQATPRRGEVEGGQDAVSKEQGRQPRGGGMKPRRRRPGDKGGSAAGQQASGAGAKDQGSKKQPQHFSAPKDKAAGAGEGASSAAPKPRRRRHRRSGGESGGPAAGGDNQ